jgi:hypothetical protein
MADSGKLNPGFGHFLGADTDLLAAYHEQEGTHLADLPRVVDVWRQHGFTARDHFRAQPKRRRGCEASTARTSRTSSTCPPWRRFG